MRIAITDALEIHPTERVPGRRASRLRSVSRVREARPARQLLRTLLRDLVVAVVTSAACWVVVG